METGERADLMLVVQSFNLGPSQAFKHLNNDWLNIVQLQCAAPVLCNKGRQGDMRT